MEMGHLVLKFEFSATVLYRDYIFVLLTLLSTQCLLVSGSTTELTYVVPVGIPFKIKCNAITDATEKTWCVRTQIANTTQCVFVKLLSQYDKDFNRTVKEDGNVHTLVFTHTMEKYTGTYFCAGERVQLEFRNLPKPVLPNPTPTKKPPMPDDGNFVPDGKLSSFIYKIRKHTHFEVDCYEETKESDCAWHFIPSASTSGIGVNLCHLADRHRNVVKMPSYSTLQFADAQPVTHTGNYTCGRKFAFQMVVTDPDSTGGARLALILPLCFVALIILLLLYICIHHRGRVQSCYNTLRTRLRRRRPPPAPPGYREVNTRDQDQQTCELRHQGQQTGEPTDRGLQDQQVEHRKAEAKDSEIISENEVSKPGNGSQADGKIVNLDFDGPDLKTKDQSSQPLIRGPETHGTIQTSEGISAFPEQCSLTELKVVLLGSSGAGKSATGNSLLRGEVFKERLYPLVGPRDANTFVTKCIEGFPGMELTVTDTPGLCHTSQDHEDRIKIVQSIAQQSLGYHVIVFAVPVEKDVCKEIKDIKTLCEIFGEESFTNVMFLFTKIDKLITRFGQRPIIDEWIEFTFLKDKEMSDIFGRCGKRFCCIDNTLSFESKDFNQQMLSIMNMFVDIAHQNDGMCYTRDILMKNIELVKEHTMQPLDEATGDQSDSKDVILKDLTDDHVIINRGVNEGPALSTKSESSTVIRSDAAVAETGTTSIEEIRVVLVGATGVGKSATRNSVLGRPEFEEDSAPTSVTHFQTKVRKFIPGHPHVKLAITDTPGICPNDQSPERVCSHITNFIAQLCPGPHVIAFVFSAVERVTEEVKDMYKTFLEVFGEGSSAYVMFIFTKIDGLTNRYNPTPLGNWIDNYFVKESELSKIFHRCGKRYCGINNTLTVNSMENQQQTTDIMQMFINIVRQNGERYYTNEDIKLVEKQIMQPLDKKTGDRSKSRNDVRKYLKSVCIRKRSSAYGSIIGEAGIGGIRREGWNVFKAARTDFVKDVNQAIECEHGD